MNRLVKITEESMERAYKKEPANREETGRNPDGTFKQGFSGNPSGRPKSPLKDYSLKEFLSWTDEQKAEFLSKISPLDRWKMTEGNPTNDVNVGADDELKEYLFKLNKLLG